MVNSVTLIIATFFLAAGVSPAAAEPVSTIIGLSALLFNTGLFASVGAAAAFGGAVVTGGILIGANYALAKTVPSVGGLDNVGPAVINTPEARGAVRASAGPQRRVYGRISTSGQWLAYNDLNPPYQYLMLGLARGRIHAVRAVTINNNRIIFNGGTPFGQVLTPLAVDGQDYAAGLIACFRQGLSDQAIDPLLTAAFPSNGDDFVFDSSGVNFTNLPTSFRQRGIATASFRADFGTTQEQFDARWGRVPYIDPQVEIDGHPVFDPRDPAQDIEDESTYKFYYNGRENGRNPSLIQANWLTQPFGGRLRTDQLRLDELAAAADYDDEIVHDRDGNPRPRHRADGVVLLNDNPRHVTEALLTANRAWIVQSRGRVGWVPSIPRDPEITLTEKDFLAGFDYRDDVAKRDTFNRITSRFTPPEKDYSEDDGPVYDRADVRDEEDNGELLAGQIRTPFTTDQRAVQWLQQQFFEENRLGRALDIPALPNAPRILKRKIGAVVRVQHRWYPEINGIYQLRKDGISSDWSSVSWSLREYDKAISSVDRSQDQQDFQVAEAA